MLNLTFDDVLAQVQRLSPRERLRLVALVAEGLQTDIPAQTDWRMALRATYGILADDPIERPPQLPLTERESCEL
ncbi:MAG: hypothetical protein H7Y11_07370 [Armatimonadetes bacterium]|nr:hypothetical protein [Anaerolineae bacterium]